MSLGVIVAIGVLGGVGSLSRFLLDGTISLRTTSRFPLGTLTVNALAALLLGVVSALDLSADLELILAVGALGGFSTFSTWMLESHRLAEDGWDLLTALNFALSMMLGLILVWAGRVLGGLL